MKKLLLVEMWEGESYLISKLLEECSIEYEISRPYKNEGLGGTHSGMIISGGEPSIPKEDKYPFLDSVIRTLEELVKTDLPILGICLGHQLIAAAMGGEVARSENPEVGFTNVEHKNKYIFEGIPNPFLAYEFHSDTILRMPEGAEEIAHSSDNIIQAFKADDKQIFGVQFHPEMDQEIASLVFTRNSEFIRSNGIDLDKMINEAKTDYNPSIPKAVVMNFLNLL